MSYKAEYWQKAAIEYEANPEDIADHLEYLKAVRPIPKHEPHKHELIYLSHVVKQRIRRIIRRLNGKEYRLYLKRSYKKQAQLRKEARRLDLVAKKKKAEKGGKKGKDGKGSKQEKVPPKPKGAAASETIPPKPPRRHVKWRENRYRKWRKIKFRSSFIKQEYRDQMQRELHPATRPLSEVRPRKLSVKRDNEEKTGASGTAATIRPGVGDHGQGDSAKPVSLDETKRRLRKVYHTEWAVENYDRLHRGRLMKAVAKLILQAKEQYDKEATRKAIEVVPGMLRKTDGGADLQGGVRKAPSPARPATAPAAGRKGHNSLQIGREAELQAYLKKQLQEKVQRLLKKDPSDRLREIKKKLLPRMLGNSDIRRNTYINRPKTIYDSQLRRKLQEKTITSAMQARHALDLPKSGKHPQAPVPYRRRLVGFVRPTQLFLPGSQMLPSRDRLGLKPSPPLETILPHQRAHVKMPRNKRQKYPDMDNPHYPKKDAPKKPKGKKGEDKKGKAAAAGKGKGGGKEAKGKGGKGDAKKSAPAKDSKEWKKWHKHQKRQRRKQKLRKWIPDIEKRRRVKIAQEILDEENFKGHRDLRGMRNKIRELELQHEKATPLIDYLTRRNEYLREQHNDAYARKHSEYFAVFSEWRVQADEWFQLKDQIDQVKADTVAENKAFSDQCNGILLERNALEDLSDKELSNLETDHTEIRHFLTQEPNWKEQIAHLETRQLYYDFLYQFKESAEHQNAMYISDLLQRKMHRDFMDMAAQERRNLGRRLPLATKRVLDERGLLAQEENKVRIWCDRLQRRREKVVVPTLGTMQERGDFVRSEKHELISKRHEIMQKRKALENVVQRTRSIFPGAVDRLHDDVASSLHRIRLKWREAKTSNMEATSAIESLGQNVERLNGALVRVTQERKIGVTAVLKAASALKEAFGIAKDYFDARWPSPNLKGGGKTDTNAALTSALEGLKLVRFTQDLDERRFEDPRFLVSGVSSYRFAEPATVRASEY